MMIFSTFPDKPDPIHMGVSRRVLPGLNLDTTLYCQWKGFPDTVTWSKDNEALRGDSYDVKQLIRNTDNGTVTSELVIKDVRTGNFGNYTCVGANQYGSNRITESFQSKFLEF